jgi:hypothetical protein
LPAFFEFEETIRVCCEKNQACILLQTETTKQAGNKWNSDACRGNISIHRISINGTM